MSPILATATVVDFRSYARQIRDRARAAQAAGDRKRARELYLEAAVYDDAWHRADWRAQIEARVAAGRTAP